MFQGDTPLKFVGAELFSGAGGMSLGATLAGVDVKMAVELDKATSATYQSNHKTARVINDDVGNLKTIDVDKKGKCSILFGGPPCQGFSISNQKTRNRDNPKNWQFKQFTRLSTTWKPDWIVIENVSGLKKTENGLFLEMILEELKQNGYEATFVILNAVDYGVPQRRERLFIVGSLHGITFKICSDKADKVTVKEAINDLPRIHNGSTIHELPYHCKAESNYARFLRQDSEMSLNNGVTRNNDLVLKRYEYIPQGGNWSHIPEDLMANYQDRTRCHGGIYYRLKEDDASVVIGNYRKNMLIHPTQSRGLSVREAARLQSFPDWFHFKGLINQQQQQVGDAVPPLLAKAIFDTIVSLS